MTTLWRHRGFLHLWGAQAASAFGTRIGREAIALSAVMLLGSGPLDLAWLNLAMSLPYLIFGLAAGVLIDRVRRRPLLIATDLIRAGLLLTIPTRVFNEAADSAPGAPLKLRVNVDKGTIAAE